MPLFEWAPGVSIEDEDSHKDLNSAYIIENNNEPYIREKENGLFDEDNKENEQENEEEEHDNINDNNFDIEEEPDKEQNLVSNSKGEYNKQLQLEENDNYNRENMEDLENDTNISLDSSELDNSQTTSEHSESENNIEGADGGVTKPSNEGEPLGGNHELQNEDADDDNHQDGNNNNEYHNNASNELIINEQVPLLQPAAQGAQ
eukprot:12928470-Ditylum_brightwellii.AAC.1